MALNLVCSQSGVNTLGFWHVVVAFQRLKRYKDSESKSALISSGDEVALPGTRIQIRRGIWQYGWKSHGFQSLPTNVRNELQLFRRDVHLLSRPRFTSFLPVGAGRSRRGPGRPRSRCRAAGRGATARFLHAFGAGDACPHFDPCGSNAKYVPVLLETDRIHTARWLAVDNRLHGFKNLRNWLAFNFCKRYANDRLLTYRALFHDSWATVPPFYVPLASRPRQHTFIVSRVPQKGQNIQLEVQYTLPLSSIRAPLRPFSG